MSSGGGPDSPRPPPAKWRVGSIAFLRGPLARPRPDLRAEIARPPRTIRLVSRREARRLIDLTREAMVTRQRDLDVFSWEAGETCGLVVLHAGLALAAVGAIPDALRVFKSALDIR